MQYHIMAFLLGFLLDLIFGDPYFLPHPVRFIGKLITAAEGKLRGRKKRNGTDNSMDAKRAAAELRQGIGLVCIVLICVEAAVFFLLSAAYLLHPYAGMALEAVMTYQLLAVKCLKVESMKVYRAIREDNLRQARSAVSMIVGRDTVCLDGEGVIKAAVETVAENTSDGVIAPMLYLAIGGPLFGFFYKAVNTMDSMVGYRNGKYLYFGRAAARLDDVANYIPARVSAYLMIAAAFLSGRDFGGRNALRIYKRDRRKHASPNSAQTESVCAGALGIRLAGPAVYFGQTIEKPYIGDSLRKVEAEDIRRVNKLLYVTAWMCEAGCLLLMILAGVG